MRADTDKLIKKSYMWREKIVEVKSHYQTLNFVP